MLLSKRESQFKTARAHFFITASFLNKELAVASITPKFGEGRSLENKTKLI